MFSMQSDQSVTTAATWLSTYQATCQTDQMTHLEHCPYDPSMYAHTRQFHSPTPDHEDTRT